MISYFKNPVAIPGPLSLLAYPGRIRVHPLSSSVCTGDFPSGVQQQKRGLLISVDAWFLYRVTGYIPFYLCFIKLKIKFGTKDSESLPKKNIYFLTTCCLQKLILLQSSAPNP
jgi:hypothetical protein